MLQTILELLEDQDYNPEGVTSVKRALEKADTCQYDLLVTDVRLAETDGINGFVLLKEKIPNLKCLVMTGYANATLSAQAVQIEVDDFIKKPFNLVDMELAVERLLNPGSLRKHYYQLIKRAPIKLLSYAMRFFDNNKQEELEKSREKAFMALYTAMKSELVNFRSANIFFSSLTENESKFRFYLEKPEKHLHGSLKASYTEITSRLSQSSARSIPSLGESAISASDFRHFFDAIRKNKIAPNHFVLAPVLKTIDPLELEKSPELLKLRNTMWPIS